MTKRSVVAGLAIALMVSGVTAVAGAKPSKQRGEGKANRLVVQPGQRGDPRRDMTAVDRVSGGPPSSLLLWRLTVVAGRPFQTK